jgi:hypothetical protein
MSIVAQHVREFKKVTGQEPNRETGVRLIEEEFNEWFEEFYLSKYENIDNQADLRVRKWTSSMMFPTNSKNITTVFKVRTHILVVNNIPR